jgi:hypothetical protein
MRLSMVRRKHRNQAGRRYQEACHLVFMSSKMGSNLLQTQGQTDRLGYGYSYSYSYGWAFFLKVLCFGAVDVSKYISLSLGLILTLMGPYLTIVGFTHLFFSLTY